MRVRKKEKRKTGERKKENSCSKNFREFAGRTSGGLSFKGTQAPLPAIIIILSFLSLSLSLPLSISLFSILRNLRNLRGGRKFPRGGREGGGEARLFPFGITRRAQK